MISIIGNWSYIYYCMNFEKTSDLALELALAYTCIVTLEDREMNISIFTPLTHIQF